MSDKRDFHAEFQAEYAVALAQAVDAAAEEDRLEAELKKQRAAFLIHADSISKGELTWQASAECSFAVDRVRLAHKATAAAKARVKLLELRWETWRTRSSDRRAELRRQEHAQAQG